MEIRGKTISYASYKNRVQRETEKTLEKEIETLEKILKKDKVKVIEEKQNELEKNWNKKLRGSFIRSRAKWIEEGEKPSKYFCNHQPL